MCFRQLLILFCVSLLLTSNLSAQDNENIELISQTCSFWNDAEDIIISENLAYVSTGLTGIQILDLADPIHPIVIGTYDDNTTSSKRMFLTENTLYYGHAAGVTIVDVSNPEIPELLGGILFNQPVTDVTVDGNIVYLVTEDPNGSLAGGLFIFDITRPDDAVRLGSWTVSRNAALVEKIGNFIYIIDDQPFTKGLHVIDVTNPNAPRRIKFWETDGFDRGLLVIGDYAYIAARRVFDRRVHSMLFALDVSDPSRPAVTDSITWDGEITGLAEFNDYLYVSDQGSHESHLNTVDIFDSAHPVLAETYDRNYTSGQVAIREGMAYLTDADIGLHIVDISDPFDMDEAENFERVGSNTSAIVNGDLIYSSGSGFRVIHTENPFQPEFTIIDPGMEYRGMSISGDKLCGLTNNYYSVGFVDCSDPEQPELARRLSFGGD